MNRHDLIVQIAGVFGFDETEVMNAKCGSNDKNSKIYRIIEKTLDQLRYVVQPLQQNTYLKACPGSGKTEVIGLKMAYEIQRWHKQNSGIAVLSFTNNAADVISERIIQFAGLDGIAYPHFVGTFDSWLHQYIANPFAHLVTHFDGKDDDRSISIIDTSSKLQFLNNQRYKTKYQYAQTSHIHANEFYYDIEKEIFIFKSSSIPNDAKRNQLNLEDWQYKDLKDTKKRFWEDGFANYSDVECFVYWLLNSEAFPLASKLAQRFQHIIIDECQDLSWIQIQILNQVREAGSSLHLIGDPNQSIYSFKYVDPKNTERFVHNGDFGFDHTIQLNACFRSVQDIVDVCGNLLEVLGDNRDIVGRQEKISEEPSCILLKYPMDNIGAIKPIFLDFLNQANISTGKVAILARSNSLVHSINGTAYSSKPNKAEIPALAIFYWGLRENSLYEDSLNLFGAFIASQFYSSKATRSNNYSCPIESVDAISWRIFLADILENCLKHDAIANLDQTWSKWCKSVRTDLSELVFKCGRKANIEIHDREIALKSPSGKAKVLVSQSIQSKLNSNDEHRIRVTTFHNVKGETLDAVLLVSSPDRRSEGGHWKHWLGGKDEEEHTRFAYVASSRPRYLLGWAVPEMDDYSILENLGFSLLH